MAMLFWYYAIYFMEFYISVRSFYWASMATFCPSKTLATFSAMSSILLFSPCVGPQAYLDSAYSIQAIDLALGLQKTFLSDFLPCRMKWNDLLGHALDIEMLAPLTWVHATILYSHIDFLPLLLREGLIYYLHVIQIRLIYCLPLPCCLGTTYLLGLLSLCSLLLFLLLLCCCCCYCLCCFPLLSLLLHSFLLGLLSCATTFTVRYFSWAASISTLKSEKGDLLQGIIKKKKKKKDLIEEEFCKRKRLKFCLRVNIRKELGDFTHFPVVLICSRLNAIALL